MDDKKRWLTWALVIGWMVLIFWFSAQDRDESAAMSNTLVAFILRWASAAIAKLTAADQAALFDRMDFIVRKLAHATLYAVLGVLVFQGLSGYSGGLRYRILLALILCVLYAMSDECHQIFVAGRSGEMRDVMIDASGACVGLVLRNLKNLWEHLRPTGTTT